MDLVEKLTFLEIPLTPSDFNNPQPQMVQRIYRAILIKSFGIPELSLSQPDFSWVTTDMQKDPDLYNRSEGFLLLTRFVQSILNDYTDIAEDTPQFGVGALVDPKARETKMYLNQLATIARLKQAAKPYYEEELARFQSQIDLANQQEEKANELKQRLEKLKAERSARLRLDDQLCHTKEGRSAALAQLTRASTEAEKRQEAAAEHLKKLNNTVSVKEAELTAANRKSTELDYDLHDDPEKLRDEVEELRVHRVEQQRVLDNETRDCRELTARDEQCKLAAKTMTAIEGEMGGATKTVARLCEAVREMHEKQAVVEERQELLVAKRDGVVKKGEERKAFGQRHEEERGDQRERLGSLSSQTEAIRAECEKLKNLEGAVKKNVLEARQKLARLNNEKHSMVAELTEYTKARMELLEKLEMKVAEKQAMIIKLEEAYNQGKENLSDAITTTDLDTSVTVTHTMQLLD